MERWKQVRGRGKMSGERKEREGVREGGREEGEKGSKGGERRYLNDDCCISQASILSRGEGDGSVEWSGVEAMFTSTYTPFTLTRIGFQSAFAMTQCTIGVLHSCLHTISTLTQHHIYMYAHSSGMRQSPPADITGICDHHYSLCYQMYIVAFGGKITHIQSTGSIYSRPNSC